MSEIEKLERRLKERFVRAFATYRLLDDGDHVLVGLSGGKDSLLLLELMAGRARISHPQFSVEAIHVRMEDVSYETDTSYLQTFCDHLQVPLHVVTTSFSASRPRVKPGGEAPAAGDGPAPAKPPCFLCSWNRRKQLFNMAQLLGCNKIALGHHRDDIIHTALMNLTFQGRFDTMPAILHMRKMPLSVIRPLCLIDEADIRRYAELARYQPLLKQCPYEHDTHRAAVARLYADMERMNPEARFSVWKALEAEGKLCQ